MCLFVPRAILIRHFPSSLQQTGSRSVLIIYITHTANVADSRQKISCSERESRNFGRERKRNTNERVALCKIYKGINIYLQYKQHSVYILSICTRQSPLLIIMQTRISSYRAYSLLYSNRAVAPDACNMHRSRILHTGMVYEPLNHYPSSLLATYLFVFSIEKNKKFSQVMYAKIYAFSHRYVP